MSHAAGRYRARLRRAIAAHLGSRDVARVIYGAIVGLALVVGLEFHPPTAGQTIAAIAGAAVAGGGPPPYTPAGGPRGRAPPLPPPGQPRGARPRPGGGTLCAPGPRPFFLPPSPRA